ncbi:MAG: L,D-transpeptidase family protein [Chloroflexi bacterium]|nr:L,D-transpeptidase family protein [Chloroflexota bacterium]
MLGLAALPSIAFAQEASDPPTLDDWPDTNPIGGPVWAVTTGEASLRASPDLADNRFGFARAGTPLQVLDTTSNGWSYVFNPHTQGTAYVASSLLAPGDPPGPYVSKPAPPIIDQLDEQIVLTEDSVLATYPTPVDSARFGPMPASSIVAVNGTVQGDDGATWYQTNDSYYVPSSGVFQPSASDTFTGRWLRAVLLPVTKVVAFEGQQAVRSMLALRGIAVFPTPVGTFSIERRVANETMDSMTLGIPHDSQYGYLVKNVLWTQYFTPDGASLHDNYWSSNFGGVGSHGCLGLSLADSKWLWDWASIGTPVMVHPS